MLSPIKKCCLDTNIVEGQLDVGVGGTPVEGVLPPIKNVAWIQTMSYICIKGRIVVTECVQPQEDF